MQPVPAPDDPIVAKVNGAPIYGSCVAAQAARGADKQHALNECIDFELLAQTAAQRALATDPEVVEQTRRAMVSALLARDYEEAHTKPEDFGAAWSQFINKTHIVYHYRHAEYRAGTYIRVPGFANKALSEQIAALLAPERGLFGIDARELVEANLHVKLVPCDAKTTVPCWQDIPLILRDGLEESFGTALWAIPEIGRASPPVRTSFGWDVIVWTDVEPAASPPDDEIKQHIVAELQKVYFTTWIDKVTRDSGLHVEHAPDEDKLLEALP